MLRKRKYIYHWILGLFICLSSYAEKFKPELEILEPLSEVKSSEAKPIEISKPISQTKAEIPDPESETPEPKSEVDPLEQWKSNFYPYALDKGVKKETLDAILPGIKLDESVIKLISHQPEFTRSIWEYLDRAVSRKRVRNGRKHLARYGEVLSRIEKMYGVQPEYIVAIWGLESSYGENLGRNSVIRSLVSLAYASERKAFFQKELIAALKMIQNDKIDIKILKGSWAGAMGHTQFMPSTYENFAVSFDTDSRKDLWNSLDDVFASTANYLKESGWKADQTWGIEVRLPVDIDWDLADPGTWLSISQWGEDDVIRADGRPLNSLDKKEARIFLPAGHKGPAFLTFENFQVIKKYNNADAYALAVGHLGDRIRGGKEIIAKWPRKDVPLSTLQKKDLQFLLTVMGYDTMGIDGKLGPNTRAALRGWQKDMDIPPDGYVNEDILDLLR